MIKIPSQHRLSGFASRHRIRLVENQFRGTHFILYPAGIEVDHACFSQVSLQVWHTFLSWISCLRLDEVDWFYTGSFK